MGLATEGESNRTSDCTWVVVEVLSERPRTWSAEHEQVLCESALTMHAPAPLHSCSTAMPYTTRAVRQLSRQDEGPNSPAHHQNP